MADNTTLNSGTGGDTVRDIDRAGVKTQVVQLDAGGAAAESLVSSTNPLPVRLNDGTNLLTFVQATVDGEAGTDWQVPTEAYNRAWNGSGWDRLRMFATGGLQIAPQPAPAATTGAITTAATTVGPVTMAQYDGATVVISGTHAGINLTFEGSNDNTVWYPIMGAQTDTGLVAAGATGVITSNATRAWNIDPGEALYIRVRSTAWTSGSGAINILLGMFGTDPVPSAIVHGPVAAGAAAAGNPVQLAGQFNTAPATVTTGQVAPLLTDANGRLIVGGAAASAAAIAGNPVLMGGTFTTTPPTVTTGQAVNLQTTNRGEQLVAISSGATAVAVKAASTAAAAADPALTVALSPNMAPTLSAVNSAATTNATSVKASAGTVFSVCCSNTGGAAAFVKLYNLATAPTVGTSVPVLTISVPASGTVTIDFGTFGSRFGTGIALAITNLAADTDTTAVAAAQVKVLTNYV